ncbi:MAG: SPOR domain-containing protein [Candidatus Cryptobacteroides sp.]
MKRSTILLIILMALTVSGCDFFRKIAGRPTSSQLEVKKMEIAAKEAEIAAMSAELARLEARQKHIADSLSYLDSIVFNVRQVAFASRHKGLENSSQEGIPYIIIGTFSYTANAEALRDKAVKGGYDAEVIPFRNGKKSVGIRLPSNPVEAYGIVLALKGEPFCPADAWLLAPDRAGVGEN